jgi:hypothetical protein
MPFSVNWIKIREIQLIMHNKNKAKDNLGWREQWHYIVN